MSIVPRLRKPAPRASRCDWLANRRRIVRPEQLEDRRAAATFTSEFTPVAIPNTPSGEPLVSELTVVQVGAVRDLNVQMSLDALEASSLKATLISPEGTRVALFNNISGAAVRITDTVFDDEASESLGSTLPPITGTFRPTERLDILDGEQLTGLWQLEFERTSSSDTPGMLHNWSLGFDIALPDRRPYQNAADPPDVNDDGVVTVQDALDVVLYYREFNYTSDPDPSQPENPSKFVDVDGSEFIGPMDVYLVVARLRRDLNA